MKSKALVFMIATFVIVAFIFYKPFIHLSVLFVYNFFGFILYLLILNEFSIWIIQMKGY